jgi:hypothetical protein
MRRFAAFLAVGLLACGGGGGDDDDDDDGRDGGGDEADGTPGEIDAEDLVIEGSIDVDGDTHLMGWGSAALLTRGDVFLITVQDQPPESCDPASCITAAFSFPGATTAGATVACDGGATMGVSVDDVGYAGAPALGGSCSLTVDELGAVGAIIRLTDVSGTLFDERGATSVSLTSASLRISRSPDG